MPSNLPSSFASAAAGQSRGSRAGRDGGGSGDWARREGRSTNGSVTFRRSSTTPFNQPSQPSETIPAQAPAVELGQQSTMAGMPNDGSYRYSRGQLLDIYKHAETESRPLEVASLYVPGWNPGHVNGNSTRGWGKSVEGPVPQDPGVCWDTNGRVKPIGLQKMSLEEEEMFASDVNSPLKLPQQKDGNQGGMNGRKASISRGGEYGLSSPSTASRPGTRRRETTDTNPFPTGGLTSPTGTGRFSRDDPWLARRSTDTKESTYEEPEEDVAPLSAKPTGFGGLMRSNTAGSTGFGAASSLWGPSAASTGSAMGSFGSFAMPPTTIGDKRFGSTRGESRLAHLIPKESSENMASKANEASTPDFRNSWRSRPRTDTDPFGGDDSLAGNAAPSRGQDTSPPPLPHLSHGHPYDTPLKGSTADFGMSGLNLGAQPAEHDTASPETNPYGSPAAERGDEEHEQAGTEKPHPMGVGSEHASQFGSLPRGFNPGAFDGSDRSQTSSVGAKGFPGLNNLGGWPSAINTATPDRDRPAFSNAFGTSVFSPVGGELQSPSFGGVPGVFSPASVGGLGGSGSLRGSSKMGSLFPAAMQAQMQNQEQESLGDSIPDLRHANPLGAIGRGAIGLQARDTDSPLRAGRGIFEDMLGEATRSPGVFSTTEQAQQSMTSTAPPQPFHEGPVPTETPQNAPRTMVMPDRMRWQYLDPQGEVQGPFTGLEMNDWYKANFFTPDLRVKKLEETDFEPLGQLIRRIGNSREPFLVPQMGVAHGPPSATGPFSPGDRGVIPPLVGAFPSFGRTLTAEEQNNLERRKQEEQYIMARQREMLAQHHVYSKMQIPPAGVPGALHHHSSAHSLQSQPSFGSITSPLTGPQPPIGAMGPNVGFFEQPSNISQQAAQAGVTSNPDFLREDLNLSERQMLASLQAPGASGMQAGIFPSQPPGGAPVADTTLRGGLPGVDQLQKDSQGFSERLKEFTEIRAQREAEEAANSGMASVAEEPGEDLDRFPSSSHAEAAQIIDEVAEEMRDEAKKAAEAMHALSLTQQVQKTQAAAAAAQQRAQAEEVWAKPVSDLPMPFPPPQGLSATPLPAPTAQRTRSTLPDQYAASRSQSETPESATASSVAQAPPAPWAREPGTDSHKGPSLKEIQEAEAKKAKGQEEALAAARRAAAEQEAAALREREKQGLAVAPGLPTTSTWGNGSPVTPTVSSPWAKPGGVKTSAPGLTANTTSHGNEKKKTLADIQREEEARKARERQQTTTSSGPGGMGNRRYADLASKSQAPPGMANHTTAAAAAPVGGGWATVGAGGKVKIPTGPAANRSVSGGNVKPVPPPAAARPVVKQSASTVAKMDAAGAAMDAFNKWLHGELTRGINGNIDIDNFAANLLAFPEDKTLIADAVYGSSTTMNGQYFAEEFIRRKKLADKGVVEKQPAVGASAGDSKGGSGGWSEVAKKGGNSQQKEDSMPAGFKVVPGRKKGKK